MKNQKEIQDENPYANVFSIEDFIEAIKLRYITNWDGIGVFHDGEIETSVNVECDIVYLESVKSKYPYVCWYGK